MFPAVLRGAAEPPLAAEPPAAAELLFPRERFAVFGVVADLDMMEDDVVDDVVSVVVRSKSKK